MTEKVFLDYDDDQFDLQYDLTGKDDVDAYEAEYQHMSDVVTQSDIKAHYGIHYGASANERLDVFPAASSNAPVHIFIHGGYWREGDMAPWRFVANGVVGNAITLVLPTYDVSKDTHIGAIVEQLRKAVEWTYHNIAEYGGNPENITVSGHSAGGHLAAMLMATDWSGRGLGDDKIKGVVAISGLFDMEAIRCCRFLREFYAIDMTREEVEALSPNRLEPQVKCPLLLPVGENESDEYLRHTQLLADTWKDKGFPVKAMILSGHDHFSIMNELNDPASQLSLLISDLSRVG